MNLLSVFFFSILLQTVQSQAMYAAIYQDGRDALDVKRRTHFVVVGIGKELLIKMQEAALTKALYLKKVFPQDQVIFISNFVDPEDSAPWNRLQVIYSSQSREPFMQQISAVSMTNYMEVFTQIASIQIFSHSNIHNGALLSPQYQLGTYDSHFDYVKKLKNRFTDDAYAILYGCNSGWTLAHRLSEVWGIPVAGSFTGSIIERIGGHGIFYDVDSKNVRFPESNLARIFHKYCVI